MSESTPKIQKVCSECGSANLLKDAYASWDVESQAWVLHSIYDDVRCDDCGATGWSVVEEKPHTSETTEEGESDA